MSKERAKKLRRQSSELEKYYAEISIHTGMIPDYTLVRTRTKYSYKYIPAGIMPDYRRGGALVANKKPLELPLYRIPGVSGVSGVYSKA